VTSSGYVQNTGRVSGDGRALMEKTISIAQARGSLAEMVNCVAFGRDWYIVERRGKPVAALVGAAEYRQVLALLRDHGVASEVEGIPVRINFDGERFFVTEDQFNLYGVGETPDEARRDYWLAATDYYEDLKRNRGNLSHPLRQHLTSLRRIFKARGE